MYKYAKNIFLKYKKYLFKMLITTELRVEDLEEKNTQPKEEQGTTRKNI